MDHELSVKSENIFSRQYYAIRYLEKYWVLKLKAWPSKNF